MLIAAIPASAYAQPTKPRDAKGQGKESPKDSGKDAGPSPEAREANTQAVELSKQGKYAEALELFQKAYDLSPSYVILYNVGRMSRLTQDFARSLQAYKRFLAEGGADIDASQRTEVEQEIAQLTALVGWASIKGEDGSEVSVDGKVIGTLPMNDKLPINPGPRAFVAKKGDQHREVDVTATAAETSSVDLSFKIEPLPVKPKPSHPFRFPGAVVVSTWVATGLFTATAIVTGSVAIVTSNDLADDVYVGPALAPPPNSPLKSKANRIDALATSTDVFVALASVSAAAAVSFTIVNAVAGPEPKEASDDPAPKGSVEVHAGLGSFAVTGSF